MAFDRGSTASSVCRPMTTPPPGMEDLFQQLDVAGDARRAATAGRMMLKRGKGMPTSTDQFLLDYNWKPPPGKDSVRDDMASFQEPFRRYLKQAGDELGQRADPFKPTTVDGWEAERLTTTRGRPMPRGKKGTFMCPAPVRPLPEPEDSLCLKGHQEWLKKHAKERDRHINAVFHARQAVDCAEQHVQEKVKQRALATDLLTRGHLDMPEFSEPVQRTLTKIKRALGVTRAFAKGSAYSEEREKNEAKKDHDSIMRAKSSPHLRLRPPTPEGTVKHVMDWRKHNMTGKHLRSSTPWVEDDGMRELYNRGLASRSRSANGL